MTIKKDTILSGLFVFAIFMNVLVWFSVRDVQARWLNVPPPPGIAGAAGFGLGDEQLAYRMIAVMLQNLGDMGGRSTPLKDYNYEFLGRWMMIENELDSKSSFVPFLASFYFGGVQDPAKLPPIIDYLEIAGQEKGIEKWRWLAQAVYLARFKMEDLDRALGIAHILAAIEEEGMPAWTKQMPAFIYTAKGDKEAAYAIMMEILKSSADKIHPNEVNFTRDYICTRILEEGDAKNNPLCKDIP